MIRSSMATNLAQHARATSQQVAALMQVCTDLLPRQVNHLGPYLLTRLLEGALVASAPSRRVLCCCCACAPTSAGAGRGWHPSCATELLRLSP